MHKNARNLLKYILYIYFMIYCICICMYMCELNVRLGWNCSNKKTGYNSIEANFLYCLLGPARVYGSPRKPSKPTVCLDQHGYMDPQGNHQSPLSAWISTDIWIPKETIKSHCLLGSARIYGSPRKPSKPTVCLDQHRFMDPQGNHQSPLSAWICTDIWIPKETIKSHCLLGSARIYGSPRKPSNPTVCLDQHGYMDPQGNHQIPLSAWICTDIWIPKETIKAHCLLGSARIYGSPRKPSNPTVCLDQHGYMDPQGNHQSPLSAWISTDIWIPKETIKAHLPPEFKDYPDTQVVMDYTELHYQTPR
ncbi:uncharacterized protein LOC112226514 [Oncorhynchus tshawytscha]|uniref:uncharacterized protein LOC112226514 n=1 Tax=Oncorhynchus tshawytscha TaxID=74940 RepID=UPI001C3D7D13|nr:uncharacterized protein LOC112226514 [Oncorhynchus tshawytscha]XP_042183905.1 uncharacterized protein LOC112226514 [Oncorhynchus tshawytscha]